VVSRISGQFDRSGFKNSDVMESCRRKIKQTKGGRYGEYRSNGGDE
jgi:hypothetical protein